MSTMPHLPVDGAQLAAFFDATCRYADPKTYLSLRAFYDDESKVFFTVGHQLGDDPRAILPTIEKLAAQCTMPARPIVFAPPLATFRGAREATQAELANGLALSVECDSKPSQARQKLEFLLGPATMVVASGGEWPNPDTGEVEDKLHLHWRLNEPTRTTDDHARLKRARELATHLVGGDASNKPIVHPIRWPGSWHRKAKPRLTRIVAQGEHELDLSDALEKLAEAAGQSGAAAGGSASGAGTEQSGEERDTAELIHRVLAGDDYHAALTALAMRYMKGGMHDAQIVLTLRGFLQAVPEAIRDLKDGTIQTGRWQSRYNEVPRTVSTARAKCGEAASQKAGAAGEGKWPPPLDFLAGNNHAPPILGAHHLPAALFPFVTDTAARMGVDPVCVALSCIVSCAAVVSETWKVQPKRYDTSWTESPRLWAAIVGDPSILKTPVIAACTKPIDKLDAEARHKHGNAMRAYREKLAEWKQAKESGPEPKPPKLDRYLIEGATIEAISEVLRDDDEARHHAPAGKVLSRHDEMSEFFGNLDRYKAGGKGGGDRGAYLRLYNGGRYTIDRIMRGSFSVPNWSACYLGGIQPGPIQRIAKDAAEDGLLQRFLYAVPGPQEPGLDQAPHSDAQARYEALFPALVAMYPPRLFGSDHPQALAFHTDAHQHRETVDNIARAMALMPDTSIRLKAALGKWPGMFARIALTFHLIEIADTRARGEIGSHTQVIAAQTAQCAAAFMLDIALPHLIRADALMFATVQTGHAKWVGGYILAKKLQRITVRDLVRDYGALSAPEARQELEAVMGSLVAVGWLEPESPANSAKPVHAWAVNPAVHVMFPEAAERERARRENARAGIAAAFEAFSPDNSGRPC